MVSTTLTYISKEDPLLKKCCISALELATGRKRLLRMYNEILEDNPSEGARWMASVKKLEVSLKYSEEQLAKTPSSGPVVFIANHPFGVLDGLAFGALIEKVRPNFLFPVNSVLCKTEALNNFLLPIDFAASREAMRTNIETKKIILEHLKKDGTLAIFPSGGVATARGLFGKVEDLEWKRFVAKVIQQSRATVIPMFFNGRNSRLFQIVSQFSETLRLGLLLHELNNKIGKELEIVIGDPIHFEQLEAFKDRQQMLDFLKVKTFELGTQIK